MSQHQPENTNPNAGYEMRSLVEVADARELAESFLPPDFEPQVINGTAFERKTAGWRELSPFTTRKEFTVHLIQDIEGTATLVGVESFQHDANQSSEAKQLTELKRWDLDLQSGEFTVASTLAEGAAAEEDGVKTWATFGEEYKMGLTKPAEGDWEYFMSQLEDGKLRREYELKVAHKHERAGRSLKGRLLRGIGISK